MPSNPTFQRTSITNFTPGIADDPGIGYPSGQAQRTNTFRCRARSSGALIPAPGQFTTRNGQLFETSTPASSLAYYVAGFYCVGPVLPIAATPSGVPEELWIATEWAIPAPTKKRRVQRLLLDETPVVAEDIITQSSNVATEATIMNPAFFCQTRSNRAAPTTPGLPVVIIGWGSAIPTFGNIWEFPDDQAPTTNTPYVIYTPALGFAYPVTHQGRVIWHEAVPYSHGVDQQFSTGENIRYMPVNDVTAASVSVVQTYFPEAADGYSVKASMTANELLLIKESGAIVIIGDIANPTVSNLPMVAGNAEFLLSNGVRTPMGFMYPALGLWLWPGGDSSRNLSPMMKSNFYKPPPPGGQPVVWWHAIDNLVFLSNNFFYDTDTQAFWQIEDPSQIVFAYSTGARHHVYCAKNLYTNESPELYRGYDVTTFATSYSWQSQPLWETIDQQVEVRQIELRATGTGVVNVTVTAQDGTSQTQEFIIGSTIPAIQRQDFRVKGTAIIVRIESDSQTTAPAPTVYGLDVAWEAIAGIPAGSRA